MPDNLDVMPTAHLLELKRSVDGKLAMRDQGDTGSFGDDVRRSQGSFGGYEDASGGPRSTFRPAARKTQQRPASAGQARGAVGEVKVVPLRRPITPLARDGGGAARGSTHHPLGGQHVWDRPSSARDRRTSDNVRDDVDIFSNDRKPVSLGGNMMRPHSARQAQVAGKIGALGISGMGLAGAPMRVTPQPPKAGAFKVRTDLMKGVSLLRRFYDRGDLPICVRHCSQDNEINWKVPVEKLDYHYYLPIFFDGLREKKEPYAFFARKGILDMIKAGEKRIVAVLPQLIIFIKNALNTRDPDVVRVTLKILQTMVKADERLGEAMVPYYRQLLPIFNLLKANNNNSGDAIDYAQVATRPKP